ncbi:conserved protein of unknown function [Tenacibaculum sp. 190524A02b]|uniref:Uncharacterized protein n=1 Tax=Tenacibaculum vairaonense TaxID=3137860 RepID=A0ABM9PKW0_9FLAO
MNIQNQILEFAEKHSLKEKAFASIDIVMDASIEFDNEIGIDFLDGNDRDDLIYEFGRFEFQIDRNGNCKVVTIIKIYSKKLYGPNCDVPVGYYEEWTDLKGDHLDEFLIFDWTPINLNIDYHIERISKTVPQRYFKRNIPEYEFTTYINHLTSLFQGKQFDGAIVFLKRCLDYLEKDGNKEIEKEYLSECLELFQRVFHFVKNNNLIEPEKLDKYRINGRIKNEKLIMAKKS